MTSIIAVSFASTAFKANAAYYQNKTFNLKQPDNSEVEVKVTGDEYYQHIESPDGYTLCRNDEGWICYADLDSDGDEIIASEDVYTGSNSVKRNNLFTRENSPSNMWREKHIKPSDKAVEKERNKARDELSADKAEESEKETFNEYQQKAMNAPSAQNSYRQTESIKGLTLIIDFSDQNNQIPGKEINDFMNKQGYTGYNNKGSVRDFFYDVSGGAIEYKNDVIGIYRAQKPKSYYDSPSSTDYSRALELVREALNWLKSNGFDFSSYSKDRNGDLRAVNIFYAGTADAGWAKGLWPHRGYIPEGFSASGVTIHNYELSCLKNELSLDTICHENSHLLFGFPDLYDYSGRSGGCGAYSLMSYSYDPKNPEPPDPYCRSIIAGWNNLIDLNNLNNSTVTLKSSDNGNQDVYKWTSDRNRGEYYLIENIQKRGRYSSMPDEGMLIWHIDEKGNNANYQGTSDKHYQVSVVQADGKREVENRANGGGYGDLFHKDYKDYFNDGSEPSARWWYNTDSKLNISDISRKGSTMTFKLGNTGGSQHNTENLALKAKASSSFCSEWENISALNDGFTPANSNDRSHAVYGNWPKTGRQWVQYTFDKNYTISMCDLYWFKDGQGIDVPASYKIMYWNGNGWSEVSNAWGLGRDINKFNRTYFTPINTSALVIDMESNGSYSTGILEWSVY